MYVCIYSLIHLEHLYSAPSKKLLSGACVLMLKNLCVCVYAWSLDNDTYKMTYRLVVWILMSL